ncbi:hypothetical protein XarbCFBP8150_15145 [Xanthomonas arboricola]|nr:hypothetical protein XarbCFBP8150_15145 [Xanthomonas arboricola]
MPRKSLHGRTCGVSCEGGRARALQPSRKPTAPSRFTNPESPIPNPSPSGIQLENHPHQLRRLRMRLWLEAQRLG